VFESARRNENVPFVDQVAVRLASLGDEIATRKEKLQGLRTRVGPEPNGTQRRIIACSEAVIADLIAEQQRITAGPPELATLCLPLAPRLRRLRASTARGFVFHERSSDDFGRHSCYSRAPLGYLWRW
jgi:hypothetical protein